MKKRQVNTNKIVLNKFVFGLCLFLLILIMCRIVQLGMADKIDGMDVKKMAQNRNTQKEEITANRGTIFDSTGEILAQNVPSYTVIAYLDEKRSEEGKEPRHVVDINDAAQKLSPVLNMSVEDLLKLLSKDVYQVELGPGGRGISEVKKEEIEELKIPGIDFIQNYKRYYPNGDFASYLVGYAKVSEDGTISGEMGIEKEFNDELSGTNGHLEYQKDLMGYKIPNTPEIRVEPENGNDIYLTIDSNIQLFLEQALIGMKNNDQFEWATITIADANTGKILAASSTPSFDPNIKNITSYLNPLVSYTYEPGSTMKIYTYMAALEKGTYDGNKTYLSGKKQIGDDTINDWNEGVGWGTITYDQGFARSSNTGIANMLETFIDSKDLKDYLTKMRFGKKTGIQLPNEESGKIKFTYPIEIANAGFGQGITTTPIQHIQALTSIANNGTMLKPYIIDKIVDSNTGEIIFKGEKKELGTIAKQSTIDYIKNLMYNVVHSDIGTGKIYNIEGYELIGKTGTAQVVDEEGKYSESTTIRSFEGMFPKDNPEIIVYASVKGSNSSNPLANTIKKVLEDTAKYLKIVNTSQNNNTSNKIIEMPNLKNKNIETSKNILYENGINPIVIGSGSKVINQFPSKDTKINSYDKVFIITDTNNISLPDIMGYSKRDALTLCNLLNYTCEVEGNGYVSAYEESLIDNKKHLKITFIDKIPQ